jgi:hypothetical protein
LARTPIEVYQNLLNIEIDDSLPEHIGRVVSRFGEYQLAGEKLSVHLARFIELCTRIIAMLDAKTLADLEHLTMAIDTLDHFTSASKWWHLTREMPGFVIRPSSRDPRDFIKSMAYIKLGSETINRIESAHQHLSSFLDQQELADTEFHEQLCKSYVSAWTLLSAFACKERGGNITSESDFETAYDILRILMFYTPLYDFKAITSLRKLATSPIIPQIAQIEFSPGFERKLDSSLAARLERQHGGLIIKIAAAVPGAARSILTNSLRLLSQLQALRTNTPRLEEEAYADAILEALHLLDSHGVSSDQLRDESNVFRIFKGMVPAVDDIIDRLSSIIRRLEAMIVDASGNKDFLFQNSRVVPRLVSLLLLLASATNTEPTPVLRDIDLKRGVVLLELIINAKEFQGLLSEESIS